MISKAARNVIQKVWECGLSKVLLCAKEKIAVVRTFNQLWIWILMLKVLYRPFVLCWCRCRRRWSPVYERVPKRANPGHRWPTPTGFVPNMSSWRVTRGERKGKKGSDNLLPVASFNVLWRETQNVHIDINKYPKSTFWSSLRDSTLTWKLDWSVQLET